MRSWLACILVLLVSAPLLAQTAAKSQATTTTTTAKPKTAAKKKAAAAPVKKAPTTATELKTLRDAVNAQQQQIQMLRDELQRRDAAMQQVQSQLNSLQSTASQAQSTAQAAASSSRQNEDSLAALKTNVASVQTTVTATASSLQAADKKIAGLDSPLAVRYKGITITPGGFIAAQVNWRNHNQNLDNFGSFGALPFNGSSNAHMSEFRETARYTRLSLLAQGKTKTFDVQAYYEMDFEGAAQTGNENQTNSWQPRIRELWANVDAPHGISFAGGQQWSLITGNRTGIGPRGILLPSHISASLLVGWHYTRQNSFRVYKRWDLANKRKLYWAFSAEEAQTTASGSIPGGYTVWGTQGRPVVSPGSAANCAADTVTGGLAPCSTFATGLSVNPAPDLITKVAFEPGWGHFEVGGLIRFFRDRTALSASTNNNNAGANHVTVAGGIAINAVLPVVAKKVDVVITTMGGRGIGRYNGDPDVTYRVFSPANATRDATLQPLMSFTGAVGIETHPHPNWDILIYGGADYIQRSPYYTGFNAVTGLPNAGVGYGQVFNNLIGCQIEIAAAVGGVTPGCSAVNRTYWEVTPGFWYRFYRGPAGTIQYGMFYGYYRRNPWAGALNNAAITGAVGSVYGAPRAELHEILTAFRWYFP